MYYLYKDHLGSITAITNSTGAVVERRSFDAWGRLRNPDDWSYINIPAMTLLDRGYTGHEHLTEFGLINMNGRMYDPVIGRMLSPDRFVVDVTNSQDFNRYTYARNNPMCYVDPDGEIVWFIPIIIAVVVYAAIDYGIQVANNVADSKQPGVEYKTKDILWNKIDWFDVIVSGVEGGLTTAFPAAAPAIRYLSPVVKNAFNWYGDGSTELVGKEIGVGDYFVRTGLDVTTIAMTDVLKHGVAKSKSTPNKFSNKPLFDRWDDAGLKDIWKDAFGKNPLWDAGASIMGTMAKNGWRSQYNDWQEQQQQPPLYNPKSHFELSPRKKIYNNSKNNTDDFMQLSKYLQLTH
jgi:RHS repeat-associated protein